MRLHEELPSQGSDDFYDAKSIGDEDALVERPRAAGTGAEPAVCEEGDEYADFVYAPTAPERPADSGLRAELRRLSAEDVLKRLQEQHPMPGMCAPATQQIVADCRHKRYDQVESGTSCAARCCWKRTRSR